MSLAIILAIILLIVILAGLFYNAPAPYGTPGKFIAAIAAVILFLVAVGVVHL